MSEGLLGQGVLVTKVAITTMLEWLLWHCYAVSRVFSVVASCYIFTRVF